MRKLRELSEDLFWMVVRFGRSVVGWVARHRGRALIVAAAVLVYLLVRFVASGDEPDDEAIALVPGDAYAYLHIDVDRDSDQFDAAADLASRLPQLAEAANQGIGGLIGIETSAGIEGALEPWLGGEAAFALARGPGGLPESLVMLEIGDESGAQDFAEDIGDGPGEETDYRGTQVTAYPGDLSTAEREGFLLIGPPAAVRAGIDASLDSGSSLADDDESDANRSELPESRLADLYISADGIDGLAGAGGLADQLDTFADFGASEGITASVSAEPDGLSLELISKLDPEVTAVRPGFFSAFPEFDPALAEGFGPDTLFFIDVGRPSETVEALLDQARAASPSISAAFERLDRTLAAGGVDLKSGILPLLKGEAAVGLSADGAIPRVTAVFDDVDSERIDEAVAELAVPLIEGLDPVATGQAPTFSESEIAGVVARSVRLTPTVNVTYAVKDGRLVVSSDPAGVAQALEGTDALAGQGTFEAVTAPAQGGASALVFFDLEGLVTLAEPQALAGIRSFVDFRDDIARLEALGLTVRSQDDNLHTSAKLEIK